jgi:hypothetical protein
VAGGKSYPRGIWRGSYFEHESSNVANVNFFHDVTLKQPHPFAVLSELSSNLARQLELFALVNLGLVQSMASGILTPTEAVERFYHARNCLHVRKHLRKKEAQLIMSRGVQLPDLFDCLPPEEAQRELYHELETMRALCLKLLRKGRSRNAANHAAA